MPGPYRIDLVKQETVLNSGSSGYRLVVTAQNPLNISEKIFVYMRTGMNTDIFHGVCTPAHLATLPEDDPDPELLSDPKRFRKEVVDIVYSSVDLLDEGWDAIYKQVDILLSNLDIMD